MNGKQFGSGGRTPASSRPESLSLTAHQVIQEVRAALRVDFSYDPAEPLFVTVVFRPAHDRAVTWQISRTLMCDGLRRPTGNGDVRIWPLRRTGRPVVRLRLHDHGSTALFEIDLADLQDWLARTCEAVPPGTELDDVDWDAALRALVDGT
ncbi:SsgA family sporulation/cell division regulator [Streptomyces sp. GXMU-J15]|uniref:SsgA family sporulation/cell division regulator n=1 Tax=Streptomyces fuscus TaxID=3048495 RepID=A0ABT7J5I0_9ACTN|nr:SsgA family sporulation/cell division regulator [Streptomyces fuscus]MDL2079022.1 SsgA family sporulation/cell division regulator [Streptomyces fuscus]